MCPGSQIVAVERRTCSQTMSLTMMLIIMMFLHMATVLARGNISCSIPAVKPMKATSLTCSFPEDLSLSRKDFSAHIFNSTSKPVLDCLWVQGELECFTRLGFEFNKTVTDKLTMWIPRVFPNMTGHYYCKMADSTGYDIQHCQFVLIIDQEDEEEETNFMAIVLSVVLIVLAGVIALVIFWFCKRNRKSTTGPARMPEGESTVLEEAVLEEELAMISTATETQNQEDCVDVTQMFEEHMKIKFREVYPEETGPFYFVPPVYFNKVRYKKKTVAGNVVYFPDGTDPSEVMHDRAMRYVFHCLHRIVEENNEHMFVLTQFQYDDYLNNPGDDYEQHQLPMPSDLTGEDTSVACFDILIVHRDQGILVGVVKAVSDKDVNMEGHSRYHMVDEVIVREVTEAIKQLKKADRIIKHLLSDLQQFPTVRLTLILPNLTCSSLRRAITQHQELLEEMQEILAPKASEDPFDRCLCAMEVLNTDVYNPFTSGPFSLLFDKRFLFPYYELRTPEELHLSFLTSMRQWWKSAMSLNEGDMRMTTLLYHSMSARFCGPATQPAAEGQEEPFLLPKTLAEAVSLTGDLYERVMLYPDMTYLQKEERMFLTGSPNTFKTRMLTLTGEKWLSEGHDVYVICNPSVPRDSVISAFLDQFSQLTNSRNPRIDNCASTRVHEISCNFKKKKERNETLDILISKGETTLCVLAYEVDIASNSFKDMCKRLKSRRSDVRLWATSGSDEAAPDGWKCFAFQQVSNCPPAVVREASSEEFSFAAPIDESQAMHCLTPTDGPTVKYITHTIESSRRFCDCTGCGRKVADFLLKHLITRNEKRVTIEEGILVTSTTIKLGGKESTDFKKSSILQDKDILVLFENNKRQEVQFLRGLTEWGIKVHTLKVKEDKNVIVAEKDAAWAMNVDQLRSNRPQRKIVVYVESPIGRRNIYTKLRGIMSCTSQLIIVRHNR